MAIDIENEIRKIKERNARVEADKAWETSNARRGLITLSVYILALLIFLNTNTREPMLNALIPAMGYFLSTITLPPLKEWWMKSIYKK